jgi:hypothetical protein
MFHKSLLPGIIIVSDRYSSYTKATSECGSSHEIVNHTEGFVNEEGAHTNNNYNF